MTDEPAAHPPLDKPITSVAEDILGRAPVAQQFIRDLLSIDASDGVVAAIMGPWGHGKSSFINLMKEELKSEPAVTVIDFNPWMFSGTQQLSDFFFAELSAQLKLKGKGALDTVAELVRDYSDALSPLAIIPFFGGWLDRTIKAIRTVASLLSSRRERSASSLRDRVSDELESLSHPIIFVIDDIDRLDTNEIRDIFRLVRLTASFPNLIYVLSFDRARVEAALGENGISGRAYLEKIVQLGFDLPATPQLALRVAAFTELDQVIESVEGYRFDNDRWTDVYIEIIEPMLGSMRDISRFVSSARFAISSLGRDVEIVDILALESLRIFQPHLFDKIKAGREPLTTTHGFSTFGTWKKESSRGAVDEIVALEGSETRPLPASVVNAVISRIFPSAQQYTSNITYGGESSDEWRRKHRVAHIDFLNLYLERVAPTGMIALQNAERAVALLPDEVEFREFMTSLKRSELKETLGALELYTENYPAAGIAAACVTLLALTGKVPRGEGLLDFSGGDIAVARVILRMLKSVADMQDREAVINDILEGTRLQSGKLLVIKLFGSDESKESLVSSSFASSTQESFAQEVAANEPTEPDLEWDLLRVCHFANSRGYTVDIGRYSPSAAWSVIRSAKSQRRSQSGDTRAVRTEQVLAWEPLVEVFGGEDAIRLATEWARNSAAEMELVSLVDRYLSGWRPRDL